jgi:NAD(P)-dependent dehydrogenase (short-subunit alcohol dehydrogenase family)
MGIALITGGSRGLGRALAAELLDQGWAVVIDARDPAALGDAESELAANRRGAAELVAIAGDVTDEAHRVALVAAAERLGGLDLLVNNASTLGATPMPELSEYPLDQLRSAYEVNVVAPLALVQAALPLLHRSSDPRIINVSSDAAVEAYEGWGGYGSSKAALDHLSAVLAVEEPGVRVWAVDPGDMATQMQQDAFPGEDVSDRPPPGEVVPRLVGLIEGERPSGRIRAAEVVAGR